MSKKYSLIINIAMIVIGIIGMLLYFISNNRKSVQPQQIQQIQQVEVPQERISVAVAQKDLVGGTVLTSSDFKYESRTVAKDSDEIKNFKINGSVNEWMVRDAIKAGSEIPVPLLIKPGTVEYIRMSAKPGQIVYGFSIKKADSYLFANLKVGGGVDIYLSYNLVHDKTDDGQVQTISSIETSQDIISNRRFKLLLKNKKILSIARASRSLTEKVVTDEVNPMTNEGYMLVELTSDEVRILKGLDGGKFYIFPTTDGISQPEIKPENSVLIGAEGQWPIDNRNILFNEIKPIEKKEESVVEGKVKEYRGANESK
ncbi:hypothetical protein JGC56_01105 [Salmonella enterica subsp. enterica serovar Saintpaul]|nr:hypothetical protein [Salmonella enterica subsp. enterica serovar Saintpaul]